MCGDIAEIFRYLFKEFIVCGRRKMLRIDLAAVCKREIRCAGGAVSAKEHGDRHDKFYSLLLAG